MTDLITPTYSWERRLDESEPAYEAFREYLKTRNIAQSAKNIGKQRSQFNEWASKYDWHKRALDWDNSLTRKTDEKIRGDFVDLQSHVITQEMSDYKMLHDAWRKDMQRYVSEDNNLELVDRTAVYRRLIMSREALATLARRAARMPMSFGASREDDAFDEADEIVLSLDDEPVVIG